MTTLPSGTVTFLFTDLEGSTRLWEAAPEAMRAAVPQHDHIVTSAIESNGGVVFKQVGDGLCAAFSRPDAAVRAALDAQRALGEATWPDGLPPLRARMGLHTGSAEARDGDYLGPALNRVARLMGVGHGGQVLLSSATERLVRHELDPEVTLTDLGSHTLRDLTAADQIFQLCHPDLPGEFPPIKVTGHTGNLPLQVSSFVGRDDAVASLSQIVVEERVVTLTGVGGVGKTRLAVETGALIADRFPDGVWLVELAPIGDPAAVDHTVATVIGAQETAGATITDSIVDALRPREALLIFDNCEHLLAAAGTLADRILRHCPSIRLVATSREPLAIEGERIVPVRSLTIPREDEAPDPRSLGAIPSVALFMDRARAGRPDLTITEENAGPIAEICRRLDGVPLALELAAARVRSMSPAEIASRLDERFRLLRSGRRTAMERHQTLRATVEWSYGLLDEEERILFDRLSVFAGGFTLRAAEEICGQEPLDPFDMPDLITGLAEKSMLAADHQPDGTTRFSMLETIRQYGEERLQQSDAALEVGRRHAEAYAALTSQAYDGIRGPDEARWVAIMDREFANVRAAFQFALTNELHSVALGIPADIEPYATWRLRSEVFNWASEAIEQPGADTDPRYGDACASAAFAAGMRNQIDRAEELARIGMERASAHSFRSFAAYAAGIRGFYSGDASTIDHYAVARDFALEGNDFAGAAMCEGARALIAAYVGKDPDDIAANTTSFAERAGQPTALAFSRYVEGEVHQEDDPVRAAASLEDAIAMARRVSNRFVVGIATVSLASVKALSGRNHEAASLLVAAVREWRHRGNWRQQWVTLRNVVEQLARMGDLTAAATLLAAIENHEASSSSWGSQGERLAALRERMQDELPGYEAAATAGRELDPDDAVRLAVAELQAAAEQDA